MLPSSFGELTGRVYNPAVPDDPDPPPDERADTAETSASLLGAGTRVDQFQVLRLLGRGGMGEVYLARDTTLGRRVALKVLRPEALGTTDAVERFLHEARATARFSHPHIVTIYVVGTVEDRPYLALEYLEGQTLRQRMAEGPLPSREALRVALAVAEALDEAHDHGVLHRDLKPENVIIGRDGRVRVLDFGLAKVFSAPGAPVEAEDTLELASSSSLEVVEPGSDEVRETFETMGGSVGGTPAYMAPEQWGGGECTGATDVWALGLLLYEMVSGQPALSAPSHVQICFQVCSPEPMPPLRGQVPGELRDLVARCLDKDAAARPPVAELGETLSALLALRRSLTPAKRAPFRGLEPMDERDAERFFGRDEELAAFLERIRTAPVMPVVGSSGAGKSSFVLAGAIPRLQEQERWIAMRMRPGRHPLRTLAALLMAQGRMETEQRITARFETGPSLSLDSASIPDLASPGEALAAAERELAEELTEHPTRLALRLVTLAQIQRARVLLFVDQLEEVFTLGVDRGTRWTFLDAVCRAADDPQGPVRVVFTARDDFLGRLAEVASTRQVLGHSTVLRRPEPAALEEILARTVGAVGYRFEDDRLPREMAAEVQGERAALPLLQFAAHLLWQRRDESSRTLKRAAFRDMGGVAGALAHHADGILEELGSGQVPLARMLLLRLVTPLGTRQTRPRSELLDGLGPGVEDVLDRLVDGRLVAARRSLDRRVRRRQGDEAELELVHDSLIRTWGSLARWIDETREERTFLDDVQPAAQRWHKLGRSADALWQGDVLAEAVRARSRCAGELPDPVGAFLDAGVARARQRVATRRALAIGVIAVLALVAVAMSALTYEAREQRQAAEDQRAEAELRRSEAELRRAEMEREGAAGAFRRGDLIEARAKLRSSLETADDPGARALWWHLRRTPLTWERRLGTMVWAVDLSPDGTTAAAGAQDGLVYLIDVATHALTGLRGHRDQVFTVEYSRDGLLLASGAQDGGVLVRDASSGTPLWRAEGHSGRVTDARFDPTSTRLVTGSLDGTLAVWDARTGELLERVTWEGDGAQGLDFSPDGGLLAAGGSGGSLRIWNSSSWEVEDTLIDGESPIQAVRFSPDGEGLAVAIPGEGLRLFDTSSWEPGVLLGSDHGPGDLAFSRDGSLLASGGQDQTVRVWDVDRGTEVRRLEGHESPVWGVQFGPEGRRIVSASRDETVRLWDLSALPSPPGPRGHGSAVTGLAFRPDGLELASAGVDGTVRFWDPVTGESGDRILVQAQEINQIAYHPQLPRLASTSTDANVRIWDLDRGQIDSMVTGHDRNTWGVDFSPDGRFLASSDWGGRVVLWDLRRGVARHVLERGPAGIWDVRFRHDGRELLASDDLGRLVVWSAVSGQLRRVIAAHDRPRTWAADYSPDGRQALSGGDDRAVRITDLRGGKTRMLGRLEARVHGVRFHPDGTRACVTAADGAVYLWPVDGGEPTALAGHRSEANACRFSPDGRLLATSGDDHALRLWEVDSGRPFWRTVVLLPAQRAILTHRGWRGTDGLEAVVPPSRWRAAVEGAARASARGAGGLCLVTAEGQLERWDMATDVRLGAQAIEEVRDLTAGPGGCLALLAGGDVVVLGTDGELREVGGGGSAVAWNGEEILVAAAGGIHRMARDGTALGARPAEEGASAIAALSGGLVAGYAEGGFQFLPSDSSVALRTDFEDVPASAVTRVAAGPAGTVAVGFASGEIGLWEPRNGGRLHRWKLHGAITHAAWSDGRLQVATELGDPLEVDLSVYERERCEVLRDVWEDVSLVWEEGHPVVRDVPADHSCRP